MAIYNYPNCSFAFWTLFLHAVLLYSLVFAPNRSFAALLGNETDRFALLKFKESVSDDLRGVLRSWNDSVHICGWLGIRCGIRHQRVTTLDLQGYSLRGTISPHVGNLSFLRFINLRNNSFFGEIPEQVGLLSRLQHLNLSYNMLEDKIPVNLSRCSQLRILNLGRNTLVGSLPSEVGSLAKLVFLNLETNNLTGHIPASLGNLSSLEVLSMGYNNLAEAIPDRLGRLKGLDAFSLPVNNLSGSVPLSLYNISTLSLFSIPSNHLKGTLPPTIGLTLPNLQEFLISFNEFSGIIPESFSNASQLQMLDFHTNNFVGQVPTGLGNLNDLWALSLNYNDLGNYATNSWDFLASLTNCSALKILSIAGNKFGGVLPQAVGNLSTRLSALALGGNKISGNIPPTLENLVNLDTLGLEFNRFVGVFPDFLGKLINLRVLFLNSNNLEGKVSSSIGNLTQIFKLDLSSNKLEGTIPLNIANCQKLQLIDFSDNRLSGRVPREIFGLSSSLLQLILARNTLSGGLPVEVGKLKNIVEFDLSENNLTGEIPEAIQGCESVELFDLNRNFFRGALPLALASLRGLQYLDLSRNIFTGKIPKDLEKLHFLSYLNLSFNHLEGDVPTKGIFQNTSVISIDGNPMLCGGVPELQLPRCTNNEIKRRKNGRKLTITIVCVASGFLLFSGFVIFIWRRKATKKSLPPTSTVGFLSQVTYKRLYEATNGFSPTMLIGSGSFGSVYKGIILDQAEYSIAVKVLNLQKKGAEKSFISECNAFRTIRHRNLVKVLTCCSSTDYNGNDFKALVFEYMSNGSLESWIHLVTDEENWPVGLSLIQRVNIAVDVASAMQYLHDDCDQEIIHCDLKPSNVLLDSEMVAHVSDFGLARLISNNDGFSDAQTSTVGIKGTVGYIAPEYASGSEPSKEGDIYSYGILVLEMFTGRRPTNEIFEDDFNLHNFVKSALPERLVHIVDSALLSREVDETAARSRDGRSYNNNAVTEVNNVGGGEIDEEVGSITFEKAIEISAHLRKCLLSVLEIGLACSQESPDKRMKISDVIKELNHIRNTYLRIGVHGKRRRENQTIEV